LIGASGALGTRREAGSGRSLGAAVELRFLDVPFDELVRRVVDRHANGGLAIKREPHGRVSRTFKPPTEDELALYDPPL
jgi:hypothetical protein